jgi:DNA-binding MurR/RpiR family transcriptional regulator
MIVRLEEVRVMNKNIQLNRGSCIIRIKGVYDSLKSAEKRLADYVLQNPQEAVNSTMKELCSKSESSYATLFRFCRKLGFPGYKEFRNSLIKDIILNRDSQDELENFPIGENTPTELICERIFNFAHKILEDSMTMLDTSLINKAVDKILTSKSVYFIGAGTSGISARYAFSKFFRLGMPAFAESDPTIYRMKASIMGPEDTLFVISSSGRTASVVDSARTAKKCGAFVISLSDFAISPITKVSDLSLYTTPRNASLFLDNEMPLIIGQITILDIMYSCCCIRLGGKALQLYAKTKDSADEEKLK